MRQVYKIERRLPFGFTGDGWGKLYKRYTPAPQELVSDGDGVIKYDKNFYVDIGQDVQFKESTDEEGGTETPNTGLAVETTYITVKTTDAYWNLKRRRWECIVSNDDLVRVYGRLWIVQNTSSRIAKRTPAPMKVFFCELRSIL